MPQQPELKGQRGSLLAGVLVLSVIMVLAAGGYVLTAGMLQTQEEDSIDNRNLMRAGESVAQMAVRYMRDVPVDHLYGATSNTIAENQVRGITPNYPAWTTFQNAELAARMENPAIRAAYTKTAGKVHVRAWAYYGSTSDTVYITWMIDNAVPTTTTNCTVSPYCLSILTLKDWKDTVLAYR